MALARSYPRLKDPHEARQAAHTKGRRRVGRLHKFIQTLDDDVYVLISARARERGVSFQEFFRAVIVPEWAGNRHLSRPIQEETVEDEKYAQDPTSPREE